MILQDKLKWQTREYLWTKDTRSIQSVSHFKHKRALKSWTQKQIAQILLKSETNGLPSFSHSWTLNWYWKVTLHIKCCRIREQCQIDQNIRTIFSQGTVTLKSIKHASILTNKEMYRVGIELVMIVSAYRIFHSW